MPDADERFVRGERAWPFCRRRFKQRWLGATAFRDDHFSQTVSGSYLLMQPAARRISRFKPGNADALSAAPIPLAAVVPRNASSAVERLRGIADYLPIGVSRPVIADLFPGAFSRRASMTRVFDARVLIRHRFCHDAGHGRRYKWRADCDHGDDDTFRAVSYSPDVADARHSADTACSTHQQSGRKVISEELKPTHVTPAKRQLPQGGEFIV